MLGINIKKISIFSIFLIGVCIMIYPLVSRIYYDYQGSKEISHYENELNEITDTEIIERLKLGYAYNNALLTNENKPLGDPYSKEEKNQGIIEYAKSVEIHDKIGTLTIPKISMEFPIYAGTSEIVLQKGVGHMEGTSLPIGGLSTHSVLTAHRGLPENKLFTDLDQLELDDLFFIKTIAGELAYKIIEIKVIEPTDTKNLVIDKNKDLVTLLTCTPFMVNSHRLLVIGERTEVPKRKQEETLIKWWKHLISLVSEYIWVVFIISLVIVLLIIKK